MKGRISAPARALTLLDVYPVGSIYISVNATNPGTLFGGSWEQLEDRFLLGAGATYAAGSSGGTSDERLTISQIPSHNHGLNLYSADASAASSNVRALSTGTNESTKTYVTNTAFITSTGGGASHNNMPPYLAVYIWKRTA